MALFICFLLLVLGSYVTAGTLEDHLKATQPELHRSLHIDPWWISIPPFWVLRFLSASKRKSLVRTDKALAIASIVLLSLGFAAFGVFFIGLRNPDPGI